MPTRARVLGRVPIGRVVAAQRRAALLARPQVDPLSADLHALIALMALRMLDRLDRAEVKTASIRHVRASFVLVAAAAELRP